MISAGLNRRLILAGLSKAIGWFFRHDSFVNRPVQCSTIREQPVENDDTEGGLMACQGAGGDHHEHQVDTGGG